MSKVKESISDQISSEIEVLIEKKFKGMPSDQKEIIENVISTGKTLASHGKSKQWVQALFSNLAKDIWSESKKSRELLEQYIESAEKGNNVYLHAPTFSKKYKIIIFFWLKAKGFRKRGDYLISDKDMVGIISPKKKIYEKIKKEGLPVVLGGTEDGVTTRERMLYDTAEDDNWIVSEDGLMIIGSSRVSFIANYCHYQVNANISIWRLYHFFRGKNKNYLLNQKIETVFKFLTYIKIRKSDIRCTKLRRFTFKLKNQDTGKTHLVWDAEFVIGTQEESEVKRIIGILMQKDLTCQ